MDDDHPHGIEDEPEPALHLAESEGVQTRVQRREQSVQYVRHVHPPYETKQAGRYASIADLIPTLIDPDSRGLPDAERV